MLGLLLRFLELQASQTTTDLSLGRPNSIPSPSRRHVCQTLLKTSLGIMSASLAGLSGSPSQAQPAMGGRPPGLRLYAEGILGLGYKLRAWGSFSRMYQHGTQQRLRAFGQVDLQGPSFGRGHGELILDATSLKLIRGRLEYTGQGISASKPQHITWLFDTESGVVIEDSELRMIGPLPQQARDNHDWVTMLMLLRHLPLKDGDVIETTIWTNILWNDRWTPYVKLNNVILECFQGKLQGTPAIRIDGTLTPADTRANGSAQKVRLWISDDTERRYLRGEIPWLQNIVGINIDTHPRSSWPASGRTSWPEIRIRNMS